MSHKTVRRYQPEEIRGVMHPDPMAIWIQLEGPFVHADDYDTLRTQARELADAVNNTVQDPVDTEWVNMKKRAQAVLDATKEGG